MNTVPQNIAHWTESLTPIFAHEKMQKLLDYLQSQREARKTIYPPMSKIFTALEMVKPENVKVVILGQDPYHRQGQAHGLSFSVQDGVKPPPSLMNMFKELVDDLNVPMPKTGNLTSWAHQGVLLLNTLLTVEEGVPLAHKGQGWEYFTDSIIEQVSRSKEPIVFILWGGHAQKKGAKIDKARHLVIREVHPSPLSSHRGFFGSKPYSKANAFLEKNGRTPIDWRL